MRRTKPVNTVQSGDKPLPPIGTQIRVETSYLFLMNSTVPAIRIKQKPDGHWTAIPSENRQGLIVFIEHVMSKRPSMIQITRLQDTVVFAREVNDKLRHR